MSIRRRFRGRLLAGLTGGFAALALSVQAQADSGVFSVARVMDLLEEAPSSVQSRELVTAYLTGVGEAAGALLKQAKQDGISLGSCSGQMNLSGQLVAAALTRAVPDQGKWASTQATPIIVSDMLGRAGC